MTTHAHAHHDHHGHDHHHGDPHDWAARAAELVNDGEVSAPAVNQAIDWLAERSSEVRAVLDVGAGPGVAACRFAEVFPQASVLAVDGAEELLEVARDRAEQLGLGARFSTRKVSLPDDLADLEPVDLVWVSGVVHHLPDPVGVLRKLGALVRPGGLLAVREGGLPYRILPDGVAPGLLPRLEAQFEDRVAAGLLPSGVEPGAGAWPDLMRAAGLEPAGTKSFLLDRPAPLSQQVRQWLHNRLTRLSDASGELSTVDREVVDRLLDQDSPESLLRRGDVFLLSATTIHTARP